MRSFAVFFLVIVDHTAYTLGHEKNRPLGIQATWECFGVLSFLRPTPVLVLMWSMERHPPYLELLHSQGVSGFYPLAIAARPSRPFAVFAFPCGAGGNGIPSAKRSQAAPSPRNLLLIQDLVQRRKTSFGVMWTPKPSKYRCTFVLPAFFLSGFHASGRSGQLVVVLDFSPWLRF